MRPIFMILAITLLATLMAACVRTESDDSEPSDQPDPAPTLPADNGENEDWYEELATEKTYPEVETGENILELAEAEETFLDLWAWFQLDETDRPEIDWETQMVLFAGTGESSSCPLVLTSIEFDEQERFIAIAASQDVPAGQMCTMDWTPRVFVIALDRDYLGEGELRALLYDPEIDQEIVPDDGIVIRAE